MPSATPATARSGLRSLLTRLADNTNPASLANRYRRRRFELFCSLVRTVAPPYRLLDVGGTGDFWRAMEFDISNGTEIVVLNTYPEHSEDQNVRTVVGDARDMSQFGDGEFDVVFSNSVIEHVGDADDQRRMASEVQRVGRRYFVQTPNYYFPLEPHFLFPFFQFLPVEARARLLTKRALGWYPRCASLDEARHVVQTVRLLTSTELRAMFPNAKLYRERVAGMTKSLVAYGGWGDR